jgi:hypothetical protein
VHIDTETTAVEQKNPQLQDYYVGAGYTISFFYPQETMIIKKLKPAR